jgi:SAM-dependent methyltransferase
MTREQQWLFRSTASVVTVVAVGTAAFLVYFWTLNNNNNNITDEDQNSDNNNSGKKANTTTAMSSSSSSSSSSSAAQDAVNDEWNGMAGEWDDLATGYRNSLERVLLADLQQLILERHINTPTTVLDFGCGTGLLTESLRLKLAKQQQQQQQQSIGSSKITATRTEIQFYCWDAAPAMIRVVQEKIKAGQWENVQAQTIILAQCANSKKEEHRRLLEPLYGTMDLIVASSVLYFIPTADLPATMHLLGKLLKPNTGLFYHSDWPCDEEHYPDGLTTAKAEAMYAMAGLTTVATRTEHNFAMGRGKVVGKVFLGMAIKKPK